MLKSASSNGSVRSYEYDANRNLLQDSLQLDNLSFVTSYEYEAYGHRCGALSAVPIPHRKGQL